jgi:hypothetical protein
MLNNNDSISDLNELLCSLNPRLNEGVYVFVSVPPETDIARFEPIATFVEEKGISLIVEESQLQGNAIDIPFRAAWITLTVNSDLNAVGLTAAVANALARKGISCNMVAGAKHDHLFVPIESASQAMDALSELQAKGLAFGQSEH